MCPCTSVEVWEQAAELFLSRTTWVPEIKDLLQHHYFITICFILPRISKSLSLCFYYCEKNATIKSNLGSNDFIDLILELSDSVLNSETILSFPSSSSSSLSIMLMFTVAGSCCSHSICQNAVLCSWISLLPHPSPPHSDTPWLQLRGKD